MKTLQLMLYLKKTVFSLWDQEQGKNSALFTSIQQCSSQRNETKENKRKGKNKTVFFHKEHCYRYVGKTTDIIYNKKYTRTNK